jgi:RimJ/RimL family protein N-acetyltransferase
MDAGPFSEVANNMAIASQMSRLPHPYSEKNAESWIAETRANTDPLKVALVITLKDGIVAGATGVSPNENGEPEINYFLGEAYWGCGLATEAAQAVIDHAFAVLDIERIIGRCMAANRGSRRVLEKCGFQFSFAGMCNCTALNASIASEEFVLERSVWQSLKRWSAA